MVYIEKYVTMPDSTKIYYRVYNPLSKKDPIICLPGLAQNSLHFHNFAQRRATEFDDKILTIDMCGRGRSDYCDDSLRYDILREVGDIIHIMIMSEDIDEANFVGTSRGGMQTAIIAGMRPDKIKKVVLNDIGIRIPMEEIEKINQLFKGEMSKFKNYEETIEAFYNYKDGSFKNLTSEQEQNIIYSYYYMLDENIICNYDYKGIGKAFSNNIKALKILNPEYVDLSSIIHNLSSIPTLLIRGENSKLLTEEIAQETLSEIENGSLATIKDRGHAPLLNEKESIEAIDSFLE